MSGPLDRPERGPLGRLARDVVEQLGLKGPYVRVVQSARGRLRDRRERLILGWRRLQERRDVAQVHPPTQRRFHLVSSQRNAGAAVVACLDSVFAQRYPRDRIHHVLIDDASDDGTVALVERWLREHAGHGVSFVRKDERVGGCQNNLTGFRMGRPGDILVELNGDDRLPDPGVLEFLNRVYESPDTWMTCGTLRTERGDLVCPWPIAAEVVARGAFRERSEMGRHLHSFRQELFAHLPEESLIDPETGAYFVSGDDSAFYYSLQELAGRHARHLYRITCILGAEGIRLDYGDEAERQARDLRIAKLPPCTPLASLAPPVDYSGA